MFNLKRHLGGWLANKALRGVLWSLFVSLFLGLGGSPLKAASSSEIGTDLPVLLVEVQDLQALPPKLWFNRYLYNFLPESFFQDFTQIIAKKPKTPFVIGWYVLKPPESKSPAEPAGASSAKTLKPRARNLSKTKALEALPVFRAVLLSKAEQQRVKELSGEFSAPPLSSDSELVTAGVSAKPAVTGVLQVPRLVQAFKAYGELGGTRGRFLRALRYLVLDNLQQLTFTVAETKPAGEKHARQLFLVDLHLKQPLTSKRGFFALLGSGLTLNSLEEARFSGDFKPHNVLQLSTVPAFLWQVSEGFVASIWPIEYGLFKIQLHNTETKFGKQLLPDILGEESSILQLASGYLPVAGKGATAEHYLYSLALKDGALGARFLEALWKVIQGFMPDLELRCLRGACLNPGAAGGATYQADYQLTQGSQAPYFLRFRARELWLTDVLALLPVQGREQPTAPLGSLAYSSLKPKNSYLNGVTGLKGPQFFSRFSLEIRHSRSLRLQVLR